MRKPMVLLSSFALIAFCCVMPSLAVAQQTYGPDVLGADSNGNGIRDDLEPMLASRYAEGAERKAAIQVLKNTRKGLGAATQPEIVETSRLLNRSFDCVMQTFGPERGGDELVFLRGQMMDTKVRITVWLEQFNKLAGVSFQIGVPNPCDDRL